MTDAAMVQVDSTTPTPEKRIPNMEESLGNE